MTATSRPHWAVLSFVDLAEPGAPRTHVLEFGRALLDYADVTLVNPTSQERAGAEGIEYTQVTNLHIGNPARFWNLPSVFVATAGCLRRLHRRRPLDVVYIRDDHRALAAYVWTRYASVRAVVEVNGSVRAEEPIHQPTRSGWRAWVWFRKLTALVFLRSCGYCMADRVVVVADGLRQELVSQYGVPPAKVGVFANGANVKLFTPLDPVECKRKLALDPRRRYIGFVGNMYKWQGVDDLIAAFSATAVEHADAQLLIVGDGVEAPNLKALVQRLGLMARVDFVGRVPYSEVVHYINACEFCVGAFNEMRQQSPCSPLKVYEYLACGKPVLASDLVEIRFIAENGVGALFPVGKIDAMAAGLQVMLSLPRQEIEAMGARARRLVVERFTWEATAKAVFDFVNSKRVAGHS